MFEKLSSVLKKATDKIAGALFVDKKLIEEIVKDLQRALIEADVNVLLVKEISEKIRKEAENEKIKGVEKKEHIIKILHDELQVMLGGEKKELELKKGKPQKIMLIGTYGAGKTTTSAKLANYYGKRGFKTCILGLDVHRPAAREQLEQLGTKNNLNVFIDKTEKDAVKTWKNFKKKTEEYDITIVDSAGRHTLDKALVEEIKNLEKEIKPDYVILVLPADIGQGARKLASEFQEACNIKGVIVTRMDSSARGGGALTACNETKAPVFFITTGEHMPDIEPFNPSAFISRILGMGDLEALLEKVQSVVSEKDQEKMQERLKDGKFTLLDFYEQLKGVEGMGAFSKIKDLIPGLGKAKISDDILDSQEKKMKGWKHAIQSMTQEEIENPEILEKQTSRIQRVAKGAGITTSEVRALLNQYKMIKEVAKSGKDFESMDLSKGMPGMSQKQMMKFAKKFGKKMRL
jgi:signal recognition particle subunit SRP54